MKKLKIKVFATVFIILSIFTFLIMATSVYRNYLEKKNSVFDILTKVSSKVNYNNIADGEIEISQVPGKDNINQGIRRIYLDFSVYTIVLNDEGGYYEIINHTSDDFNEDNIKKIANNIINNHNEKFYIGNLYCLSILSVLLEAYEFY